MKAELKLNDKNNESIFFLVGDDEYILDFVAEDQSYLRNFFKRLLEETYSSDAVTIDYEVANSIKNETIKKVAKEYVVDLEKEINKCILEIKNSAKDQEK